MALIDQLLTISARNPSNTGVDALLNNIKSIYPVLAMIRNYLKIAFRSMLKNKAYVAINIVGLALGISCCILILLFVEDELGFDRFHDDYDQIYRLRVERFSSGGEAEYSVKSWKGKDRR